MRKAEILKGYTITKLDDVTVFIKSKDFDFSYTVANSLVKEEFKDQYKYFGGLQCNYNESSVEYKQLEKWLCEIAEMILGY